MSGIRRRESAERRQWRRSRSCRFVFFPLRCTEIRRGSRCHGLDHSGDARGRARSGFGGGDSSARLQSGRVVSRKAGPGAGQNHCRTVIGGRGAAFLFTTCASGDARRALSCGDGCVAGVPGAFPHASGHGVSRLFMAGAALSGLSSCSFRPSVLKRNPAFRLGAERGMMRPWGKRTG